MTAHPLDAGADPLSASSTSPDATPLAGPSRPTPSYPGTLSRLRQRDAAAASASSSSSTSTPRVRPGYFDLQRLALQAEREESARYASTSSAASIAQSQRSMSVSTEGGGDAYREGEDEADISLDDEADQDSDATIDDDDARSSALSVARAPSRTATTPGVRTRPPSRSSMRSPPPLARSAAAAQATSNLRPLMFGMEEHDEQHDAASNRMQFLASLHRMSDAELERHAGSATATASTSTPPARPQPSPLYPHTPNAPHSLSSPNLKPTSALASTSPSSIGASLAPPTASAVGSVKPFALIRDLSQALRQALDEVSSISSTADTLRRSQASALHVVQRRHEAREAALRDILRSAGVSEARVSRALTHATTQADVPVFVADERRAMSPPPGARNVGVVARRIDAEEALPNSIAEAMLEELSEGLGLHVPQHELLGGGATAAAVRARGTSTSAPRDGSQSHPAAPSSVASSRRSTTTTAGASTHKAGSRSDTSSLTPSLSDAAPPTPYSDTDLSTPGASGISIASSSVPSQRERTMGQRNVSTTSLTPSLPASAKSTASSSASFGWGLWGAASNGGRKAAASVQSVSPAAVEADGYMSDGGHPSASAAAASASRRPHGRSASVSAASFNALGTGAGAIPARKQSASGAPPPAPSAGGVLGGFGLIGSLAWRRKAKSSGKSTDSSTTADSASVASAPAALLDEGTEDEADTTVEDQHHQQQQGDATSPIDAAGTPQPAPVLRANSAPTALAGSSVSDAPDVEASPSASAASAPTRDLVTALHEAIGTSAPATPALPQTTLTPAALPKPSHFRAIFLATRIMTPDNAASLLEAHGRFTGVLVKRLALELVGRAREEGKSVEEGKMLVGKTRPASMAVRDERTKVALGGSMGQSTNAETAPATATKPTRGMGRMPERTTKETSPVQPNVTRLPDLFRFGAAARRTPKKGTAKSTTSTGEKADVAAAAAGAAPAPSVELEPIVPNEVKPPSLALFARRGPTVSARARTIPAVRKLGGGGLGRLEEESDDSSGDEFEVYGGKGLVRPEPPQPVGASSRLDTASLLTDRYGFVYDATPADVRLLRQARQASTPAPACLTGIRVGVRARGGSDTQSEEEKEEEAGLISPDEQEEEEEDAPLQSSSSVTGDDEAGSASHISDAASLRTDSSSSRKTAGAGAGAGAHGLLAVAPVRAVAEASALSVPSHASGESGPTSPSQERDFQLAASSEAEASLSPPPTSSAALPIVSTSQAKAPEPRRPPSTSQTVRRLLGQLQTMHEKQQAEQQAEWDDFLKRRRAAPVSRAAGAGVLGLSDKVRLDEGAAAAGLLAGAGEVPEEEYGQGMVGVARMGDSKTGKEHWREFLRLCQAGIPLCYRAKVWAECSGALEAAEPGRYQELLVEHEGESNQCTDQIDLDVHRTMPTNVFFGGDGPGIPKLRRVLVAFSWYNPATGYCQGMNNLAATLLLTHATEEEAFWVLVMIIEKILPSEYYTSHLLVSQADQRVLIELIDDLLPNLAAHIEDLGVDLPAVTFAWFLSLYTDCLPVETLFRVWDVLFVEGMVVLFRVAIAILSLNEKELLATSSPSAFYSLVHSMTSKLFAADRLVKLACEDLKPHIRYASILDKRERHVADLERELGLV